MPSLRIASIGASKLSARTRLHAVGKPKSRDRHLQPDDRHDDDLRFVDIAGLGVEHRKALSRRSRSSENSVQPSQSEAMKTVSIDAARSPRLGGHALAPLLQVRRSDPGKLDRFTCRLEGGQGAQLSLPARAHSAQSEEHSYERSLVGPSLLSHIERNLIATGDQGAEASGRLSGQPPKGLVEQGITHVPTFPPTHGAPAPARCLAS